MSTGNDAGISVPNTNNVTKANSNLQQKVFQHTPHDFTIKRAEQRNVETLALAEAMSEWISALLKEESISVRGSEEFFEDVANGVVLCTVLQKLGISVDKPKDPPKNEFEAKENRQKFQMACKRAKFQSIPSIDFSDPTVGLLPTLIECAAIDEAIRRRKKAQSLLPDAITKRTGEVASSQAVRDAAEGKLLHESILSGTVTPKTEVRERGVAANTASPTVSTTEPSRARTVSREEAVRAHRARTASEIPKEEKDQMFFMFLFAVLFALILLYLTIQLLS